MPGRNIKTSRRKKIKLNNWDCKIEEIEESIKLWLWKIFQQCPPRTKKRDSKGNEYKIIFENSYKSLFRKIVSVSKNIGVITTNYDIIFEDGVYRNNGYCGYPVNNKFMSILENSKKFVKKEDEDSIVLCKFHGSVNFFSNGDGGMTIFDDYGEGENKIGESIISDMPIIFALDAIWKIRENWGNEMVPEIIPPTYSKLEKKSWLRSMWRKSLDLLTDCEKLIFIGYGMPDSDGFMRSMIQAAMTKRDSENDLQIYVIDPNCEVHRRYRKLFDPMRQKLNHIKKRYTDSVDELKGFLS